MGWMTLQPHDRSEADIQQYFAKWPKETPGFSHLGAPDWFHALRILSSNDTLYPTRLGYGFRPDLLASSDDGRVVIELKSARKYEPLALAEALHHAHLLSNAQYLSNHRASGSVASDTRYVPVLVNQYNAWLRASLQFLFDNHLERSTIRYIEFTCLYAAGRTILWFDEPFAAWQRCTDAPELPSNLRVTGTAYWYKVEGARTWIATPLELQTRPSLWTIPYLMLTRDLDGRTLAWHGAPQEPGRYALWQPSLPDHLSITVALEGSLDEGRTGPPTKESDYAL